jgi:hypothetical protein
MRRRRGHRLEVDVPTAEELDWIFSALARPEIHLPLSLPRAPTREEFDDRQLPLVERDGTGDRDRVETLIVRLRSDASPWAFLLHYGWRSWFDPSRELDLAVARPGPVSLLVEAQLLAATVVLGDGRHRRLRWRVTHTEAGPTRWYLRVGARSLGSIVEPDPLTGAPITREVYELTKPELDAMLARIGLASGQEPCEAAVPIWQVLRGGTG